MKSILLVEPDFPIADKSKNHAHFLPIGLLKIGSYHRGQGDRVRLVRGNRKCGFTPDRILITSLFTYWSKAVHECARFYRETYQDAEIEIGGIYASLMPDHCKKQSSFAKIVPGLYRDGAAERTPIDYSLLPSPLDYQVVHASRGCTRKCAFCGVWRVEQKFTHKNSIVDEIRKPKLVFYDNNLLANPNIDTILEEIAAHRLPHGRQVRWESQSGFDLRFLTPDRAQLLRRSRLEYPRIAWDGPYADWPRVKEAVDMLKAVGYGRKDIFIFMIYNHDLLYEEMMRKRDACRRWKVRIIDCRYRPLDSTEDNYQPGPKAQGRGEYYIHPNWTDKQVRGFRRAVRHQNIAVLLDLPNCRYISGCEHRKVSTVGRSGR